MGAVLLPKILVAAAVVAAFGLAADPGKAGIIGPTNDWKPLLEGAKELGISQESLNMILDSGFEMRCKSNEPGTDSVLNAWHINGRFWTNAHAFFDDDDRPKSGECSLTSYRSLVSKADLNDRRNTIDIDPRSVRLATITPKNSDPRLDVSTFETLQHPETDGMTVKPPPASFGKGSVVILVSRRPHFMQRSENDLEPIVQVAVIKYVSGAEVGRPRAMMTDADGFETNSGGMLFLFVRSGPDSVALMPLAIHRGHKGEVDYRPWDINTNSSLHILLDRDFFEIPKIDFATVGQQ